MKFLAAALLLLSLHGGGSDVDEVVRRASAHLDAYMKDLGGVVGEEQYGQQAYWLDGKEKSTRERWIVSDFLTVPVGDEWIGIRHVRNVDDIPLDPQYHGVWRERFDESTSEGRRRLQEALTYESTRYNIGDFSRSTNVPTFPLELLDKDNLDALSFSKAGEDKIGNVRAWRIRFAEKVHGSLVMTTSIGPTQRYTLSGVLWIDPLSGSLLRAQIDFDDPIRVGRNMRMDVRYRFDPAVAMMVPDAMDEHYEDQGLHHTLDGHAHYLNFRRFDSTVRLGDFIDEAATSEPDLKRESDTTFSVRVDLKVVNVDAWVTASSGSAVTDLKQDDFRVAENRRIQTITNFSPVSTPYDALLLFDQSGSTREDWATMQKAAESFIASARPQDRVGIAVFNSGFRMLTHWTESHDQVARTVAELIKPHGLQGTAFYKAVEMSLAAEMLPVAGRRRAIVILTDGRDNGLLLHLKRDGAIPEMSREGEYLQMLELARNERVPIYVVAVSNSGSEVEELNRRYGSDMANQYLSAVADRLELLVEGCGGRVVFLKTLLDIIPLYRQIGLELGSAYSIGYVSNIPATFKGFREIQVTTRNPRLRVVQSRPGYVSP